MSPSHKLKQKLVELYPVLFQSWPLDQYKNSVKKQCYDAANAKNWTIHIKIVLFASICQMITFPILL